MNQAMQGLQIRALLYFYSRNYFIRLATDPAYIFGTMTITFISRRPDNWRPISSCDGQLLMSEQSLEYNRIFIKETAVLILSF